MDFSDFICSPLINGGCGLGKTTALTDERMYKLFARKLKKASPHVLVIESRSITRDQLKSVSPHKGYTFLQFAKASEEDLSTYDIIIIDEAHSLFSDSEFAPRTTAPLAEWLRKSLCFQIYITASDEEFISFANKYFTNKEFNLTFPDLNEAHVRYTAKEMYLSVSVEKVNNVVQRKATHFFTAEPHKGLFFILSAKDVVELHNYYSQQGYRCGFYVSQQNESQMVIKEDVREDDPEDFDEYASRAITMDILDYYKLLERNRIQLGKQTIRDALLEGHFPQDVDYLFMTSAGQEGISLYNEHLDFVFIEDTYPLTINQKLFRYRNNVDEVYIHLPQRRIEQALKHTMEKVCELMRAPQEYLKGYYEGAGGKNRKGIARAIWYDKSDGKYKIAENYIAFLLTKSETYRALRDNKDNEEWMRANYGTYADNFYLLSAVDDKKEDILRNFFADKDGVLLTDTIKKDWVKQLKDLGLNDEQGNKAYSFKYIIKKCKEYSVCNFVRHKASKEEVEKDPSLHYRKEYTMIKLIS